jgi:hypothetical protein
MTIGSFGREEIMRHSRAPFIIVRIHLLRWAVVGALALMVASIITPPFQKAYAATGWQKLTQAELTR